MCININFAVGADAHSTEKPEGVVFGSADEHLPKVAALFHKVKRAIVVTGAGISCSGGIPDFRSSDGLYNLVKSRFPKSVCKGRDLFDATLFKDVVSTQIFYSFMGELKQITDDAKFTRTHGFLRNLHEDGKLLRCYTQNIDCLEEAAGLPPDGDITVEAHDPVFASAEIIVNQKAAITSKLGSQVSEHSSECKVDAETTSNGKNINSKKTPAKEKKKTLTIAQRSKLHPVVQLHGSLNHVKCTLCASRFLFTVAHREDFKLGGPPPCPTCQRQAEARSAAGKRRLASGTLRPDIVLYNEPHPRGDLIGMLQAHDVRKKPDVLLVMGTSLKVVGLKRLVKDLAACVHDNGGKCIFVNRTPAVSKEWETVFDYQILSNTDEWVEYVENTLEKLSRDTQRTLVKTPASMLALSDTPRSKNRSSSSAKDTRKTAKGKENFDASTTPSPSIAAHFKKTKVTSVRPRAGKSLKDDMHTKVGTNIPANPREDPIIQDC